MNQLITITASAGEIILQGIIIKFKEATLQVPAISLSGINIPKPELSFKQDTKKTKYQKKIRKNATDEQLRSAKQTVYNKKWYMKKKGELTAEAEAELDRTLAEIEENRKKVYVPGQ